MAVVIETTLGDVTVDLFLQERPQTCLNFLKLCKMKYYNFNLFHTIQSGFIAQTGDPTGEGSGGQSLWGLLHGPEKRYFSAEKMPKIRHTNAGLLSMVCTGDSMVGSQFFFTLGPDLDSLDGVHCVIGEVTEGQEVLRKINDTICDEGHRPYQDVRITHTVILEDPFNDPPNLQAPSRSPSPSAERLAGGRIAPDEDIDETKGKNIEEVQEMIEEKEAKARATILEIVGDLPDAEIAPPENVLFVCKLNPVTTDEDLEIIFSRFGKIVTCEVIRDKKTGDSLQYAFIEFSNKKSCEDAYFKMDNVLIDDRRIHVDFSQSVSKIKWLGKGRGVKHIDEESIKKENAKRSRSREVFRNDHNRRERRNDMEKNYRNRDDQESRTLNKKRNRSRDKHSRSRDVKRSRSRERRSRSRDRKRNKSQERRRSKSKEKGGSKSREKRRSRSREKRRSISRERKRSKSKERKRSKSRERKRSRSRDKKSNKGRRSRSRDYKQRSRSRSGHRGSKSHKVKSRKNRSDR